MRSTIQMSSNTALNHILDNYSNLTRIQEAMSTGQRVNRPSDDPLAANVGMRLDTVISRIRQYNVNIDVGKSFLSISDTALQSVNDILNQAKSLTVGSASETTTNEMREANAVEMNNLLKELIVLGNRTEGSRYIFGGTETQQDPFEVVASKFIYYHGNDEDINVQTDTASYMAVNVTGAESFGSMVSVLGTQDLSPDVNLNLDQSTRLEDLNLGNGIAKGSINIQYTDYPTNGLNIDLSDADTLEDVKDIIERETYNAGQSVNPGGTRYIRVDINPNHDGIMLTETDWGSAPAPTQPLAVREVSNNTTAQDLGIFGTATLVGVTNQLVGQDLNPAMTGQTLLADLANYTDGPITITNGDLPGQIGITELNDTSNDIAGWNISGLTKNVHTDDDDQFFVTMQDNAGTRSIFVYSGSERTPAQLIASGTTTTGGTVTLQEENNSGIQGTVSLGAPTAAAATWNIDVQASYDTTFRATVNVPAFEQTVATGSTQVLDEIHLRGLEQGVDDNGDGIPDRGNTDLDGELYFQVERTAAAQLVVRAYRDPGHTNLVATGQLDATGGLPADAIMEGTVELTGAPGFEEISGSVHLSWDTATLPVTPAAGSLQETEIRATFATVEDLMNAVETSNTYTSAKISENGKGLEIISHLAGAYLRVGQEAHDVQVNNDNPGGTPQMGQVDLHNLIVGENSDIDGNIYAEIVATGPAPGDGTINLYKDSDRTELVATGAISGRGTVTLTAENNSGLTGEMFFNAAAVTDDADIVLGTQQFRITGDDQNAAGGVPQLNQLELDGVVNGVNSDSDGQLYARIISGGGLTDTVEFYKDPGMAAADLVATGTIDATAVPQTGYVQINEANDSGIHGSVYLPVVAGTVTTSNDNTITITPPKGLAMSGQVREENIFSSFNDIVTSMNANDTDELHNLLGNFDTDLNRVVLARADLGARIQRLELLTNRHSDEIINFSEIRADRIDLDYAEAITEFQALQNVFEASLRVTGQLIPMSLVDFI